MSYDRFRTGCNQPSKEAREIAKIYALEKIALVLEEILILLKGKMNA